MAPCSQRRRSPVRSPTSAAPPRPTPCQRWRPRGSSASRSDNAPDRSAIFRAEQAKLKSRRDDLIIAQGKRGTSAALGNGTKNEHLPFSCFAAPARAGAAKQEKGR